MEVLEQDFKQYEVSLKEDKNMLECFETGITFYIDKLIRDLITSNKVRPPHSDTQRPRT